MKKVKLKDLKKGTYFTKKEIEFPRPEQVWIRDEYERTTKRYWVCKCTDIVNYKLMKGDTEVYIDFFY